MIRRRLALPLLFAATGVFTLASQTLLLRELLVAVQGNELGIAFFFGSWLFWIAAGALVAALVAPRLRLHGSFIALGLVHPLCLALQLVGIVGLRSVWGIEPFEVFPLGKLLVATFSANAPVSFATGFLFQVGCTFAAGSAFEVAPDDPPTSPGQIAPRLYAFEALGGFVGGVLASVLFWHNVGPLAIAVLASVVLVATLGHAAIVYGARKTAVASGALLVGVVAVWATSMSGGASEWLSSRGWKATFPAARHVVTRETPYQRLSVAKLHDQTVLVANGSILASTADEPEHALSAAMLLAQAPHARRALVLGLGSEGLVPHLLHYPLERVDVVEADRIAHRLALDHLGADVGKAFRDPRVETVFADPRDFVASRGGRRAAPAPPRYDLVLVAMPDPDTAYLNRFFTTDFYRAVRSVLARRGVLATRITVGENYAGTELVRYGRSVFRSLAAVFEEVSATPGEHAWLLASRSRGQIELDPTVLERRFRSLARREEAVPPEAFATLVPVDRVLETRALFEDTGGEPPDELVNTDARPIALFHDLVVLAARTGSSLVAPLRGLRLVGLPALALPLLLLLALRVFYRSTTAASHRAAAFNGTALLCVLGAVSMCLSVLLLLSFQNRFGFVFLWVGLLSALFMLGLFTGGLGGSRLVRGVVDTRFWPVHAACLPLVCLSVALPAILERLSAASPDVAFGTYAALFFATGTLCGAGFPVAGLVLGSTGRSAGWIGGVLESADHWGGAIGAGLVGIFVVPVLGVSAACSLLALVLGCAWALFAVEQVGGIAAQRKARWIDALAAWLDRVRRRHRGDRVRPAAFVLAAFCVPVVVAGNMVWEALSAPRVRLDEAWVRTHTRTADVETVDSPFPHHLALERTGGDPVHVLVASRAVAPDVEGYGGPLNLLVVVSGAGEVEEVSIIESQETPAYVHGIDDWLGGFRGMSVDRPIAVAPGLEGGDGGEGGAAGGPAQTSVDVMTGATVTCEAVGRILEVTRHRIGRDVLHRPNVAAARSSPVDWKTPEVAYVVIALVLAAVLFFKAGTALRTTFLVVNLVVAGLVLGIQLSSGHVVRLLGGWLPSEHSVDLLVLVVGVLALAIALGPVYCGYLCPFGAAQELLGRVGLVRGASLDGDRLARRTKWVLLAVLLVAYFLTRSEDVLAFDPLQSTFAFEWEAPMWALLVVVGVLSLFYFRFWCRYLCPTGAFLALFSRLGLARRWARPKAYGRCDLGVRHGWELDCLQCNRCIARQALAREPDSVEAVDTAATTPRPARRRRDVLLLLGVAVSVLVCVIAVAGGAPGVASRPDRIGSTRTVDAEAIRLQIEEGRLSDRKALFQRRLEEVQEDEPAQPTGRIPVR